eukprot:CAMPEP_0203855076 /NCGR_PEP_ID=MMETSP0359-20131031/9442_1 /ASSEMBLY_ACC=CAM_ASM_000338 /TAXON_ID=268821 /ORGANISM="Scrippsiella Hangoei, Strain SHTV-5" /LENGTH=129 /DNA_ID=CAMNT_0050771599 /DNA_START=77 /DNA_END=466 /DNA_ORIENTATION=-
MAPHPMLRSRHHSNLSRACGGAGLGGTLAHFRFPLAAGVRNPRFRPFFFGVPHHGSCTSTATAASAPPVAHRQDAAHGVAKPLARGSGDRRPHCPGAHQKAVDKNHAASSHAAPRAARLTAAGRRGDIR